LFTNDVNEIFPMRRDALGLSHRGEAEVRLRTLEAGGHARDDEALDAGGTTLQFSMHLHLQATEIVPFQTNDLPS